MGFELDDVRDMLQEGQTFFHFQADDTVETVAYAAGHGETEIHADGHMRQYTKPAAGEQAFYMELEEVNDFDGLGDESEYVFNVTQLVDTADGVVEADTRQVTVTGQYGTTQEDAVAVAEHVEQNYDIGDVEQIGDGGSYSGGAIREVGQDQEDGIDVIR
ncbi:MAG: hypothetical protein SVU32_01585 [Candidatus Nanohaloarchaea archaeon]|nr:hypothetical protein [Candidatus Nanohaloarchaea archaeon]